MGLMLCHAGHTVKCSIFLCSLRCPELLWIASPLSVRVQQSKIHTEVPLVAEILRWWPPPLETWVKGLGIYWRSNTENTALSRKSIGDLLGCTQLILGDIMNLLICKSLQNCLFMWKQNKKSLAFEGFLEYLLSLRNVLSLQDRRYQIIANF